jgi:hypothetical protein
MTYQQNYQMASAAYHYVKSMLTIGAGNRILGQPGFKWSRQRCVDSMREVTGRKQQEMDAELAKKLIAFGEKTWGRDGQGNWKGDPGSRALYTRVQQMNLAGEFIELNAAAALQFKCGNCEEFSSLTFKYLKDHGVQPIDWMKQEGFSGELGNHAFVIVGRDKKTAAGDVSSWNKEVVWCDPYEGELGGLDLIKHRFAGEELSVLHRWDVFKP